MNAVKERVDRLEEALMRLLYIQQKTEMELQAFKEEMRTFKDEMKVFKDEMRTFKDEMSDFKDWAKKNIETMNRQWGELANKMGTLVEDIFAPSIDLVLAKYFQAHPDTITLRYLVRQGEKSLEIDILALERKTKRAFIVEVKAKPDRKETIEEFLEKLEQIPLFLPEFSDFQRIGIYAALNMHKETVSFLTRKDLYAMVLRGDILEIVNSESLANRDSHHA